MINCEDRKKYYEVECKCGHTGSRKYYIPIKFAVIASDGREAAQKGRMIPRCKHNHKDCVLNVREISFNEYQELINTNKDDPFLNCHSIQEQNRFDLSDRYVLDPHYDGCTIEEKEKEIQIHQLFIGKNKIRNPKKYFRFNKDYCMEASY